MSETHPDVSEAPNGSSTQVKCEVKTWHLSQKEDGTPEKTSVEGFGHVEASTDDYALVVTRKLDKNHNLDYIERFQRCCQFSPYNTLGLFDTRVYTHPVGNAVSSLG